MSEAITGSIEIKTSDGMSIGVPGVRWTPAAIPIVLETLHGIIDMESVEPQPQPTGRTPEGQWTAKDEQNQDVTVLLWRDVPHDDTVIARAIADAIAKGDIGDA